MFEVLLWLTMGAVAISFLAAYDGSRDPFHPLIFIAPMLGFLYVWMPVQLTNSHSLAQYFDDSQLVFIQTLYFLGTLAFVGGCCLAGFRLKQIKSTPPASLSRRACQRLRVGSLLVGSVGLLCWGISIVNVGGFVNAFSKSYSGGWDDSGYVRDGNLLLLVGVLLAVCAIASEGPRIANLVIFTLFAFPWTSQALLMARRGPTFAIAVIVLMGWYLNKNRRPPMVAVLGMGVFLGLFSLFLVTNRSSIYLGSSMAVKTDLSSVTNIVDTADTGNEYIYGGGAVISSRYRDHYFWMRRYLAQILVRPIPSAIWSTKYEDFGVPELLTNAGTGEGFGDALGWVGAVGSAPGVVADLWIELWWLCIPALALMGFGFGWLWRKAALGGPQWKCQYVIVSALSMYLVMQTLEAVIFRLLLLSVPCWIVWSWALAEQKQKRYIRVHTNQILSGDVVLTGNAWTSRGSDRRYE